MILSKRLDMAATGRIEPLVLIIDAVCRFKNVVTWSGLQVRRLGLRGPVILADHAA
jgi:hypothetical protein